MDDETAVEETTTTSVRDQFTKLVLATAVSFIAGKLAENAYDAVKTKIRSKKTD